MRRSPVPPGSADGRHERRVARAHPVEVRVAQRLSVGVDGGAADSIFLEFKCDALGFADPLHHAQGRFHHLGPDSIPGQNGQSITLLGRLLHGFKIAHCGNAGNSFFGVSLLPISGGLSYCQGMRVAAVLCTYNESAALPEVLARLKAAVADLLVVVVDDDSPDGTARVAESHGARVILRQGVPRGRGLSGREGYRRALELGADAILEMDADGADDPADG